MNKSVLYLILFVALQCNLKAQSTFPTNGAPFNSHTIYAFVNANIYVDYETLLTKGTLLIQDGKVLGAGEKIEIPKNATVIDLNEKFIYPSFIDLYGDYGLPPIKKEKRQPGPHMESSEKGAFGWNESIRSNIDSYKLFVHNTEKANELKKLGFGSVLSCSKDGIVRGSAMLVNLNSENENKSIIIDKAAGLYSFNKGTSLQDYPNSLTGAIALLRQTYLDAAWYALNKNKTEYNITLDEFNKLQTLPSVFEGNDKFNDLRASKVGKEFNVKYIVKGGGNEYQRISDIKSTSLNYIIPVNFPEAYDVEDPYEAQGISLAELKHWELAPSNPSALEKNNITFCFTTSDLKDKKVFLKNIRKAIQYGLTEKTALKALTANPAQFINASDKIGALKKGYFANFFISTKSIFDEEASIIQHWVVGEPNLYEEINTPDLRGNYILSVSERTYSLKLSGEQSKPKAVVLIDTTKKRVTYDFEDNFLMLSFQIDSINNFRGTASYNKETKGFDGNAQLSNGSWKKFQINFISADTSKKKPKSEPSALNLGKVIYPFTTYGEELPEESTLFKESWNKFKNRYSAILIKNATVWTNNGDTVLQDYDVYVVDGKIVRIAPNIDAPKLAYAKVIDAKGKHLTPGIIDEHSHIALTAGVNEGTQASSAEVRMGDVINPEDINIYRQLSGGVTTAQLLHGSANPIGGQSVLIKLRWGHNAEDMKYEKADPFIKFALGENVKQSNWGDLNKVRFPQSRMGVEQVYVDFFTRAKEYDKEQQLSAKGINTSSFRRDLELEALAEILNMKRFITCHSYVQSEINMLMHVADSFGFKVNTFTHILEGYKVADKMKVHGANASTFSDWWAYKNEVMEAIPYNAAVLTKVGVNTAINSDDAEMARRLNQEAAKCIKYGGLSETEALKLVTLNPAKMLHIDNKVGRIKVGMVADLVLWTDNPLSVYAKADKTIIDGQIYFDRDEDVKLQEKIKNERSRIITKLLLEKSKGTKVVKPTHENQRLYHCNTIEGVSEEETGLR
ncbi:amidohydrolase family protein [Aurantibacillus circumpalustris]|uniref:amidohydrolase family protein n=1 Tax=Aurantibacillus circumpalustris TaxID=3036359 RepID=UPI00295B1C89|nr:amidohydrolase family protein [Aurantibacillus circumpalustris]